MNQVNKPILALCLWACLLLNSSCGHQTNGDNKGECPSTLQDLGEYLVQDKKATKRRLCVSSESTAWTPIIEGKESTFEQYAIPFLLALLDSIANAEKHNIQRKPKTVEVYAFLDAFINTHSFAKLSPNNHLLMERFVSKFGSPYLDARLRQDKQVFVPANIKRFSQKQMQAHSSLPIIMLYQAVTVLYTTPFQIEQVYQKHPNNDGIIRKELYEIAQLVTHAGQMISNLTQGLTQKGLNNANHANMRKQALQYVSGYFTTNKGSKSNQAKSLVLDKLYLQALWFDDKTANKIIHKIAHDFDHLMYEFKIIHTPDRPTSQDKAIVKNTEYIVQLLDID